MYFWYHIYISEQIDELQIKPLATATKQNQKGEEKLLLWESEY